MLEPFHVATLVAATVTTGLMAGLFFAFSCSVMMALAGTDDRTFIEVMQRINAAIRNGWFASVFFGAFLFTAAAVMLRVTGGEWRAAGPTGAALALYVVAMVITFGVSIPLNNQLDAAGPAATVSEPARVRRRFERPWVRWNVARTLACLGAFGCLCAALLQARG